MTTKLLEALTLTEEVLRDIVRVFKFETGAPVEALAAIREQKAELGKQPPVCHFYSSSGASGSLTNFALAATLGDDMCRGIVQHVCFDRENDGYFRQGDVHMRRVGKKTAGRMLDGRLWDEVPV